MFATWSLGYDAIDAALLNQIRTFLATHEAANCIQLSGFMSDAGTAPGTSVVVARDEGEICGIATQTGSFLVMLSHITKPAAIPTLVNAQLANAPRIPGVMGPPHVVQAYANHWQSRTDGTYHPGMAQRILQADTITPPANVAGTLRKATPEDHPMLREWFTEFGTEAEHIPNDKAKRAADGMVSRLGHDSVGMLWLNDEGTPVSIACFKGKTPHGVRIGPVFTPAIHRRQGYAAAVTAATAQKLLTHGFAFVCLYTDASNATANRVYESIGFTFVTDSMQYKFKASVSTSDD